MIEFKLDSTSEKQRKRRSSRTAGLTSKDPWANFLLFRTIPEERYNIYDWQAAVKANLTPDDSPLSPSSPSFHSFTNPFGSRETKSQTSSVTDRPDFQRAGSSLNNVNSYPHAQRDRDRPSAMISPSPSLRSRRSDLSSQASSLHPPMGFTHNQNYTTTLPSDLPSPASTSGYDAQFIEGWTSAQGRSSALSSHTRASNSIASAVAPIAPVGSTPPGPRETILDRAFQMRYIPGGERAQDKDEEKISSIARFEALMREVDERKKHRANDEGVRNKSEWDLDEESGESDDDDLNDEDVDEADGLEMSDPDIAIPTPAQRALNYISGRYTPLPPSNRPLSPAPRSPPIPFLNPQAMSAFHSGPPPSSAGGLRPRAGTTSSRNNTSRPNSLALPSRSVSAVTIPSLKDSKSPGSNLRASSSDKEKRSSSTSIKRLSFQEFAKRLSSTSSLLLVQTNASSSSGRDGSRRTSSEYGIESEDRSGRSPVPGDRDARDKRCSWRGSVGVFGGEGGFL
jgi:hypothetical protein